MRNRPSKTETRTRRPLKQPGSAINVIFDGPPGPESGRFIEVETDDGHSINAGEWIKRPDGLWSLRITHLPNSELSSGGTADKRQQTEQAARRLLK